jgi:hypothetical protein
VTPRELNCWLKNAAASSGALKIRITTQKTTIKRPKENLLNFAWTAIPIVDCRLGDNVFRNNGEDTIDMQSSNEQSIEAHQKCELCEQKMNPTVKIYNHNTRLCKACYQHMGNLPEIVAKSVERFLIGNVV